MKRVFKVRWFERWARKAGLTDAALWEAVWEMERGLANISPSELEALKLQAPHLLNRSNTELDTLVRGGDLTEIGNRGTEK